MIFKNILDATFPVNAVIHPHVHSFNQCYNISRGTRVTEIISLLPLPRTDASPAIVHFFFFTSGGDANDFIEPIRSNEKNIKRLILISTKFYIKTTKHK